MDITFMKVDPSDQIDIDHGEQLPFDTDAQEYDDFLRQASAAEIEPTWLTPFGRFVRFEDHWIRVG